MVLCHSYCGRFIHTYSTSYNSINSKKSKGTRESKPAFDSVDSDDLLNYLTAKPFDFIVILLNISNYYYTLVNRIHLLPLQELNIVTLNASLIDTLALVTDYLFTPQVFRDVVYDASSAGNFAPANTMLPACLEIMWAFIYHVLMCFVVIGESIEATNYTEASGAGEWNINKFCSLFKRISGLLVIK